MFTAIPTPIELIGSVPPIEPLKAFLDRVMLPLDWSVKRAAIEAGCFFHSALLANNPDTFRTVVVHALKKLALEKLAEEDRQWGGHDTDISHTMSNGTQAILVTAHEVKQMMRRIEPKCNSDIKTVKRHLETEVATGDLLRDPGGAGYVYTGFFRTLAPVFKPPWEPLGA